MIDGKWLWGKLRQCQSMTITVRVYTDWIKTNSTLCGFVAHVRGKGFTKEEQLLKVEKFIFENKLPVEVQDDETHPTRFRIRILK